MKTRKPFGRSAGDGGSQGWQGEQNRNASDGSLFAPLARFAQLSRPKAANP